MYIDITNAVVSGGVERRTRSRSSQTEQAYVWHVGGFVKTSGRRTEHGRRRKRRNGSETTTNGGGDVERPPGGPVRFATRSPSGGTDLGRKPDARGSEKTSGDGISRSRGAKRRDGSRKDERRRETGRRASGRRRSRRPFYRPPRTKLRTKLRRVPRKPPRGTRIRSERGRQTVEKGGRGEKTTDFRVF